VGLLPRRIAAGFLGFIIAFSVPASAGALTDRQRADRGVSFIAGMQRSNGSIPAFSPIGSTADAVLAFVAAGAGRARIREALGFLRRQVENGTVTDIGLQAKVVMAVSAAGGDPRTFAGANLLGAIRSRVGPDGHIGNATVFDQALAVLAIESGGIAPANRVTDWLLDAQCPDGGWSFDAPFALGSDDAHCDDGSGSDFFTSDSNTTAYAVQALEEANRSVYPADPFGFLETVRDLARGGWAYSTGFVATDTNSTALVIQAYVAAGEPIPPGGLNALRALQYARCGAWAYSWNGAVKGDPDIGATIGAIPGLMRKPFPVSGPTPRAVGAPVAC
jgi:hypothetical protein